MMSVPGSGTVMNAVSDPYSTRTPLAARKPKSLSAALRVSVAMISSWITPNPPSRGLSSSFPIPAFQA